MASDSDSESRCQDQVHKTEAGGKPPRAPVARNQLLDAVCLHGEATHPTAATSSLWPKCAKVLATIKAATPDVTPDEIARRAANWSTHFDGATLTATALAAHWGRLAVAKPLLTANGYAPNATPPDAASIALGAQQRAAF